VEVLNGVEPNTISRGSATLSAGFRPLAGVKRGGEHVPYTVHISGCCRRCDRTAVGHACLGPGASNGRMSPAAPSVRLARPVERRLRSKSAAGRSVPHLYRIRGPSCCPLPARPPTA
jgi:hypothetical protein